MNPWSHANPVVEHERVDGGKAVEIVRDLPRPFRYHRVLIGAIPWQIKDCAPWRLLSHPDNFWPVESCVFG